MSRNRYYKKKKKKKKKNKSLKTKIKKKKKKKDLTKSLWYQSRVDKIIWNFEIWRSSVCWYFFEHFFLAISFFSKAKKMKGKVFPTRRSYWLISTGNTP